MKTIRHVIIICTVFLIFGTGSFFAGYYFHKPEPVIKEVIVTKNVDRIVYRDYAKADCCELLYKYDTSPMQIKYNVRETGPEYTRLNLTWSLYERSGFQDIRIPAHEVGNWRLYAGIVIGVAAAGGISYLLK